MEQVSCVSGCDSGRGLILPTFRDEFYGLKELYQRRTKSSLLSLWKVSDDKAAIFMESFIKSKKGKKSTLVETIKFLKIIE